MAIRKPNFWIARDDNGIVHLFEGMPVKDNGFFCDRNDFGRGIYLGKRPSLPFELKRGSRAAIDISIILRRATRIESSLKTREHQI